MRVKDGVPPKDGAQTDTNEPVSFQEIFYIVLVIVQFHEKRLIFKKFLGWGWNLWTRKEIIEIDQGGFQKWKNLGQSQRTET